jgi:hypothetical protein
LTDKWQRSTRLLLCTNHPAAPGELSEVLPVDTCRNFKVKTWRHPRARVEKGPAAPVYDESDPSIRRIALGRGLFAIIDAADYEKLSKYRWRAYRTGRQIYAVCQNRGKIVYMHRMLLRPRKGDIVDHIDGNGLNNRRCNLRVCTYAQNQANARPRGGASQFIGVTRQRDRWQAAITCQGKCHYLGLFDDEVEAARARDRKAHELHGEFAYLNFPEDFGR